MPPVGPCRVCRDWPTDFTEAMSAVWLGDEAREIIHHLKYEGYTTLAALVASRIADAVRSVPSGGILVPIPLGARRRIERGYNQAEEIAVALGAVWSVPVATDVIRRVRDTATQTALTPAQRTRNVDAAFKAICPVIRGPKVAILVDDVFTTGATLSSAASAMLDAGWREVRAVTFTRALSYTARVESQR